MTVPLYPLGALHQEIDWQERAVEGQGLPAVHPSVNWQCRATDFATKSGLQRQRRGSPPDLWVVSQFEDTTM